MKKAVPSAFVVLLAIAILATPLASAVPLKEKNNDKFQTYYVTATFNLFTSILGANREYVPSTDNVNKFVVTYNEVFSQYNITIGSHTYKQGVDFVYTGFATYVFYAPVFGTFGLLYPTSYRAQYHQVDYVFDFSAVSGGLDGTLKMQARFSDHGGEMDINSLAGTGDLQNIQIKASHAGATSVGFVITAHHEGYVLGWPE